MKNIYIISAKRTPFGAFGGSLKNISATSLATMVSQSLFEGLAFAPSEVDHIVFGQVVGANKDSAYLARHVGLNAGVPMDRPAYSVNRLCGSGFQSWIEAAQMIALGEADCVLAGGVESMSQIPYLVNQVRFSESKMGHLHLDDLLTAALFDEYAQMPMAMTAERLGEQYQISRAECDEYSLLSQARYQKAQEQKIFEREITPIALPNHKSALSGNSPNFLTKDEHPKADTTIEKLNLLKPLFKKEGLVTAGTASGIVDGAAATLIASEKFVTQWGLKPLAKIKGYHVVGCDPKIMGIGPANAIRFLLEKQKLTLNDIDHIEVNEAFSAQYLAVEKELGLKRELTNPHGGAIALGHPLGASGTRIMNHLAIELSQTQKQYAIGSACIGGGQGVAMLLEKVKHPLG